MTMPMLETNRLRIRPFRYDDREATAELNRSLYGTDLRDDWLEWVVRNDIELANLYQPPYGDRAIVLRGDDRLIGSLGLVPSFGPFGTLPGFGIDPACAAAKRNIPEFGLYWALAPECRGRGYATEAAKALIDWAFTNLNLRRVVAMTEYDNLASATVMRRLGMRIERNPFPEPRWFQQVGVLENNRDVRMEDV